jgi:hypothetical protein
MYDRLLGYLFDCLDPEEHHQIEAALQTDESLRQHLEILRRCAHPLEIDRPSVPPPKDLATNTCHKLRGLLGRDAGPGSPPGPVA